MLKAVFCCVVSGDVGKVGLGEEDIINFAVHEFGVACLVHSQDFEEGFELTADDEVVKHVLAKAFDGGISFSRIAMVFVSVANVMVIFDLDVAVHVVLVNVIGLLDFRAMMQIHVLRPSLIDKATDAGLPGENGIVVRVDDEVVGKANAQFLVVAMVLLCGNSFLDVEVINFVGPFLVRFGRCVSLEESVGP